MADLTFQNYLQEVKDFERLSGIKRDVSRDVLYQEYLAYMDLYKQQQGQVNPDHIEWVPQMEFDITPDGNARVGSTEPLRKKQKR